MKTDPCIDAYAHGGALLLTVAAEPLPQVLPDRLILTANGHTIDCEATAWLLPRTPLRPAGLGVLASLPEITRALPRRLVATLRRDGIDLWTGPVAPRTLALRDLADRQVCSAALSAFDARLAAGLPGLLDRDLSFAPIGSIGKMRLTAITAGSAFVLEGFIEGDATRRFHIVSSDLTVHLAPDERVVRRPSPQAIKRAARMRASLQPGDWTMAVGTGPMPADGRFYLVEELGPDRAACHGPFAVESERDESRAVTLVHEAFGDIRSLPAGAVDRLYRPLLALPKGPRNAQRFTFGPQRQAGDRPSASVIIPFYGDAFFLHCLFHLQRLLPPTFEIIVVVDDVRLRDACYLSLTQRSGSIAVPTILLCNESNYGYGPSNNLGAEAASGDILILMNSDVLVLDPAPLAEAVERIRAHRMLQGQELVLGFSLLYEDRTVQHLGMTFARSAAMNDLFIVDHPLKGIPVALCGSEAERPVPAVTGALMALSRDLYGHLDGFDDSFERGDFEDADLCLRARQAGAEIRVLLRDGLYHLERQSIPSLGGQHLRQSITYLNCLTFNARWAAALSAGVETSEPGSGAGGKVRVLKRRRS